MKVCLLFLISFNLVCPAAVAEPNTSRGTISSAGPSYFVRLGNLSTKVRERALQQSLVRARRAREATHASVTQMTSTLDLLETARTSMASGSNQIGGAIEQLQQRWTEWSQKQAANGQAESDGGQNEAEVSTFKRTWFILDFERSSTL